MINAHVEMNLNDHVSVVSSRVLELIYDGDEVVLEALMRKFLKNNQEYSPDQFMESLLFLFALGFIEVDGFRVVLKSV